MNHISKLFNLVKTGDLQGLKDLVEDVEVKKRTGDSLLDAEEWEGMTVLHIAARYNQPSIIKWLLFSEEGGGRAAGFSNILAKDQYGRTALHVAARYGALECCQALVQGSKIENGERAELLNAVDDDGWTVLHYAANYNRPSIIKWLLSSEEGGGRAAGFTSSSITATIIKESALHIAACSGSVECLNTLLSGCTVGERLTLFLSVDKHGWTALHCAARWSKPDIIRELLLHYPETQTIVDHRDHRGMTALHRAVIGGIDEDSREEWIELYEDNIGQEEVVEALLTFPKKIDIGKEDGEKQQQPDVEDKEEHGEDEKSQQQQQQAAVVDPNLGTGPAEELSSSSDEESEEDDD